MLKSTPRFTAICLLLLTFTISSFTHAEKDSSSIPLARISVETGVFFASHEKFQTLFETNTAFNWQVGLDVGTSTWKIIPWGKFSTFQFETLSEAPIAYTAKMIQFSGGFGFPIALKERNELILRSGISQNIYTFNDENQDEIGMLMSVGYKHSLHKNFDILFNGTYNYSKNKSNLLLNDWNGLSFHFGLAINLIG